MKKYKLKKDIVIKAGTEIIDAPSKVVFHIPYGEILIGFGKDYTASIFFDEDLMKSNTEYFEKVG